MKFLLIGPPASGKGTLGELLSEKLSLPIVSVGEVLRDVPADSPSYQKIHEFMDQGLLVPSDLAAGLLSEELSKEKYSRGFIRDGWMRDVDQQNHFDPNVDFAIYVKVSNETAIKRAQNRTDKREDDADEVVRRRLELFHTDTMPVVESFRAAGKLIEVNGEPSREEVFEEAWSQLKPHLK